MKINSIILSILLSANLLFGQAPQKMSYQAVIRNSSNTLVMNTVVGMRTSILQSSATGTAVYVETQKPTTNTNGLASIEIGAGTLVSGSFATIDWSKGPYFVKTETDISGGTNYSIIGTSQLLSVPYALYAGSANSIVAGGAGSGFVHYIGEVYQGGVIFHIWKDDKNIEHGLIVATKDTSSSQAWSNLSSTLVGANAQSTWDGLSNSLAIVNQIGHTNSAAKLCLDYVSGNYDDWYLPAIDELTLLYNNRYNVHKVLSSIGASPISFNYYWSSTESYGEPNNGSSPSLAYYLSFCTTEASLGKSTKYRVRAIRSF